MKIQINPAIGTLEKARVPMPKEITPGSGREVTPCQKNRILIVDDEEGIRRVFQKVIALDIPNAVIDMADNGAKAVESFMSGHHSVILMDLSMPVMTGDHAYFEIAKICDREKWEMPAVIFCTGFNPSSDIRKVVASDPRHCLLQKPVRNQILVETVLERLKRQHSDGNQ